MLWQLCLGGSLDLSALARHRQRSPTQVMDMVGFEEPVVTYCHSGMRAGAAQQVPAADGPTRNALHSCVSGPHWENILATPEGNERVSWNCLRHCAF